MFSPQVTNSSSSSLQNQNYRFSPQTKFPRPQKFSSNLLLIRQNVLKTAKSSPLSLPLPILEFLRYGYLLQALSSSIILFNGYPGIGKMTIATHLLKLLRSSHRSTVHLIDRSLLIDPVQAIKSDPGSKHRPLTKTVGKAIFDGTKEISDPKATIIMTELLCTREQSKHMFQKHLDFAQFRGLLLIHFEISCSKKENMARVLNSKRKKYISKLIARDRLQEVVLSDTLLYPAEFIELKGVEIRCIDQRTGDVTTKA